MPTKWKKYPLVMVEWQDHSADSGWDESSPDEEEEIVHVRTVGFLKRETEKAYYVYDSKTSDGDCGGESQILKPLVVSVKTLRKSF